MICPECRGEFVPGVVDCPDCHLALVEELQNDSLVVRSEPWVTVAKISSPVELTVLKSMLESHGVPVFVPGEHSFQQVPALHILRHTTLIAGQCKLQVPENWLERARELIAAEPQDRP